MDNYVPPAWNPANWEKAYESEVAPAGDGPGLWAYLQEGVTSIFGAGSPDATAPATGARTTGGGASVAKWLALAAIVAGGYVVLRRVRL